MLSRPELGKSNLANKLTEVLRAQRITHKCLKRCRRGAMCSHTLALRTSALTPRTLCIVSAERSPHTLFDHTSSDITVTEFGSSLRASLSAWTFAVTGFGTTVLG